MCVICYMWYINRQMHRRSISKKVLKQVILGSRIMHDLYTI